MGKKIKIGLIKYLISYLLTYTIVIVMYGVHNAMYYNEKNINDILSSTLNFVYRVEKKYNYLFAFYRDLLNINEVDGKRKMQFMFGMTVTVIIVYTVIVMKPAVTIAGEEIVDMKNKIKNKFSKKGKKRMKKRKTT